MLYSVLFLVCYCENVFHHHRQKQEKKKKIKLLSACYKRNRKISLENNAKLLCNMAMNAGQSADRWKKEKLETTNVLPNDAKNMDLIYELWKRTLIFRIKMWQLKFPSDVMRKESLKNLTLKGHVAGKRDREKSWVTYLV